MDDSDATIDQLAVKRLFEKIKRGDVHLASTVPQTKSELAAVQFDGAGDPVEHTVGPLVRALARSVVGHEIEERKRNSPVHH
jgi:hypothetical protein